MTETAETYCKKAQRFLDKCLYAEAVVYYLAATDLSKKDLEAGDMLKLAECRFHLGDFEETLRLIEPLKDKRKTLLAGQAKLGLGQVEEAIDAFKTFLEGDPGNPDGLIELAAAYEVMGDDEAAQKLYDDVKFDHPGYYQVLFDRADQLHQYKLFNQARQCLQRAEKVAKTDSNTFYSLGLCYLDLNFADGAENALKTSIKLRPTLQGYRELGMALERSNKASQALSFCQVAMRQKPDDPGLNYVVAKCEFRQGNHDKAHDILKPYMDQYDEPIAKSEAHNLMGRIHDKKGDADKAYADFVAANEVMKLTEDYKALELGRSFDIVAGLKDLDPSAPAPEAKPRTKRPMSHVFFMGFPRSGTTLIQQVMQSHPQIETIDEKPTLRAVIREIEDMKGGYPGALKNITGGQLDILRDLYFLQVQNFVPFDESTVLFDKFPLNIPNLPLIRLLFPEAKIIFAHRHPYAACLSCLMQNFAMNNAMGNLTGLDEITRFYDLIMGYWLELQASGGFPAHSYKYEDVVKDLEGEARKMTSFVGLGWDDRMLQYRETAKEKGIINTPSYAQVVQPIYNEAVEKWRAYEKYFEPFRERLQPYLDAFGYSG